MYNQREDDSGSIADGALIVIPNLRTIGNDLEFVISDNAVKIKASGTYLFIWTVLADPSAVGSTLPVVIALENLAGTTQYALSGNISHSTGVQDLIVVGSTAVDLAVNTEVVLRNRTGSAITVVTADGSEGNSFAASLTVVRVG